MKRVFDFETNIEKRMPDTGKVFMVDRMTSDYALARPFDVDGFIEEVFEHWNGTESRETIRQYFNYGLGRKGEKSSTHCPAKHRDKVLKDPKTGIGQIEFGKWPEHVGGLRPSLIEAWNKGAEYHTKGFRQGDVLPAKLPACKITRLEDGSEWIALFPKEMVLLDSLTESTECSSFVAAAVNHGDCPSCEQRGDSERITSGTVPCDSPTSPEVTPSDEQEPTVIESEQNDAPGYSASEKSQTPTPSVIEPDLFAQMQQELDTLMAENERLRREHTGTGTSVSISDDTGFLSPACDQTGSVSVSATEANHRGQSPCNPLGEAVATHTGDSPHDSPTVSQPSPRRVRRQKQDVMSLYSSPAITVDHSEDDHSERNKKILAAVATAVVFIVLVNTVGLFGIAALGLLAGGLVK